MPPQDFLVLQNISHFDEKKKQVTINKKGILNDERTRKEFEQLAKEQNYDDLDDAVVTGVLEQNIVLNVETFALESVHLTSSLNLQEKRVVEVIVSRN